MLCPVSRKAPVLFLHPQTALSRGRLLFFAGLHSCAHPLCSLPVRLPLMPFSAVGFASVLGRSLSFSSPLPLSLSLLRFVGVVFARGFAGPARVLRSVPGRFVRVVCRSALLSRPPSGRSASPPRRAAVCVCSASLGASSRPRPRSLLQLAAWSVLGFSCPLTSVPRSWDLPPLRSLPFSLGRGPRLLISDWRPGLSWVLLAPRASLTAALPPVRPACSGLLPPPLLRRFVRSSPPRGPR